MEYIIYRYSVNTIFKYVNFFGKCSVCELQKKKKLEQGCYKKTTLNF